MNNQKATVVIKDATSVFDHSGITVRALDKVSLTIPGGQFVCLLGRSGHGKSTLLRAIAGLSPLNSGTLSVDGQTVNGPSIDRGMVFQEDTVFPWMRVGENVEFGLKARPIAASDRSRQAQQWLERVGLSRFAASWPKQLSGGMRKRVAIATVFANGAPILLMDEPFGALDYVTRMDLQNLLLDLWRSAGRTIVFVTHDIEEALVLAQRIVLVRNGRIAGDIEVDLPYPRDERVRAHPEAVAITSEILRALAIEQRTTVSS